MKEISVISATERQNENDIAVRKMALSEEFQRECGCVCPDKERLCDILLDLCYGSSDSKKFVWDMCGEQIVENLLKHSGQYSFYVQDDNGEISYKGEKYRKITEKLERSVL